MIQLYYGSDTQNTHTVVQEKIVPLLKKEGVAVRDKIIPELSDEDWRDHAAHQTGAAVRVGEEADISVVQIAIF